MNDVPLTPEQQVKKAKLDKSWRDRLKQEKYNFCKARGHSEAEIERHLLEWYKVHLWPHGAWRPKRDLMKTKEEEQKDRERIAKWRIKFEIEPHYERLCRALEREPVSPYLEEEKKRKRR